MKLSPHIFERKISLVNYPEAEVYFELYHKGNEKKIEKIINACANDYSLKIKFPDLIGRFRIESFNDLKSRIEVSLITSGHFFVRYGIHRG
jgi:hypothetical protein